MCHTADILHLYKQSYHMTQVNFSVESFKTFNLSVKFLNTYICEKILLEAQSWRTDISKLDIVLCKTDNLKSIVWTSIGYHGLTFAGPAS